ncbi:unnamed protein product [Linum trigynum]|uniref:Uncharacterized protein n=1 Tax=Linum trigynum TaxID=586398 RepID=A0AAV2F7Y0_9ROSI
MLEGLKGKKLVLALKGETGPDPDPPRRPEGPAQGSKTNLDGTFGFIQMGQNFLTQTLLTRPLCVSPVGFFRHSLMNPDAATPAAIPMQRFGFRGMTLRRFSQLPTQRRRYHGGDS